MGGSSKKQTVGYKYHLGMHMVVTHGPVDYLIEIKVDGRTAWSGRAKQGALTINKPSLFGGESREGGVQGAVDFLPGGPTQGVNNYLSSKLGALVPAFRGVASFVLRQVYVGLNPYLKKWSFRLKRIHTRQNGLKQWYDPKAEINGDQFSAAPSEYSSPYGTRELLSVDFSGATWGAAGGWTTVLRSTNNGESWQTVDGGNGNFTLGLAANGGTWVGAGAGFATLRRSADDAQSFHLRSIPSINSGGVRTSCVGSGPEGVWMVGGDYIGIGYVSVSYNDGVDWSPIPGEGGQNAVGGFAVVSVCHVSGNRWLCADASGQVHKSTTGGAYWSPTPKMFVRKLRKLQQGVFAIQTTDSIACSLDGGETWTSSNVLTFTPQDVANFGDLLVAIGNGGHIALSYNSGATWETLPQVLAGGANLNAIKSDGESTAYAVGTNGVAARIKIILARKGDMNPAHIIRECLTDPDWGMGYSEDEIDDVSFKAAADTLFQENFGISILWDRQMPIEQFITEILKHIDAALYVNRQTGLFTIKLIRGDYNESSLLHLNEFNIERIDNFTRTSLGELTNSVTVNYWNSDTGNDASITVQDIALIQLQQATINTTLQYPGITDSGLASRVAQRSLKSLSTPRVSCTIYTNRTAKNLAIGDVFKLSWPDYEVSEMVMRVTEMAYGDGRSRRIRIACTQDTFSLPDTAYVVPPEPEWVDPIQPPSPVTQQIAFEVPYRELIQVMGQASVDGLLTSGPETSFVGVAAGRPVGSAINARMYVDSGASFEDVGAVEFCPIAELSAPVNQFVTELPITNGQDLSEVALQTWAQLGDELVFVTALTETSVTVKRGILDTIPRSHLAGTEIYFWDAFAQGDQTEYLGGETLDIKVAPVSGGGQVDLADAATMTLLLQGRAARPYRPGNVKANGEYTLTDVVYPVAITWTHRNRVQDTGGEPVGYYEGTVTTEAGVTYSLRVVELDGVGNEGAVLHTESGLTGESWDLEELVIATSDAPAFLVGVSSIRDGLTSYRESSIVIPGNLQAPTDLTATPEEY